MPGLLKKPFFDDFDPKKPRKSSLSVLVRHRNRSSVVELVGRELLIFARVENGRDKIFAEKTENAIFFQKELDQEQQFSVGNFHFHRLCKNVHFVTKSRPSK